MRLATDKFATGALLHAETLPVAGTSIEQLDLELLDEACFPRCKRGLSPHASEDHHHIERNIP